MGKKEKNITPPPEVEEGTERGQWGSKLEFLLSCLGYSVGLGNIWRFPYLAYENGGAAFLFPYVLLLFVIGKPLYLMETALGQYSQLGPLHVWKKCVPLMGGIGLAMLIAMFGSAATYNQLMAYTIYYMWDTFRYIGYTVPWATCDPAWADNNCYEVGDAFPCSAYNLTESTAEINCTNKNVSSATQYWENAVLQLDKEGLTTFGDLGEFKPDLFVCLGVSWVLVFLCLLKGIESSGKVVYFTATFPFIALTALLAVGSMLPGASMGIKFLFIPKWDKILDATVWRKAAEQVFYSLSVGSGGLIMFGSYNKFNNKLHQDIMILSFMDLAASLLASCAIFSVMGAMANDLNLEDIEQVAAGGPGLAFIAYPEAISRTLPVPHLWAIIFFFMLLTLGLDSLFATVETILTSIYDTYPRLRKRKALICGLVCLVCFLIGVPYCFTSGQYVFYLMDYFNGGIGTFLAAVLEMVTLHWFYGVNRFAQDLKFMMGYLPGIILKFCWAFAGPVILIILFIASMIEWENPLYADTVPFPGWAIGIGWIIVAIKLGVIPIIAFAALAKYGMEGDIKGVLRPTPEWGPGDPAARAILENERANEKLEGIDNMAMDKVFVPPALEFRNQNYNNQNV